MESFLSPAEARKRVKSETYSRRLDTDHQSKKILMKREISELRAQAEELRATIEGEKKTLAVFTKERERVELDISVLKKSLSDAKLDSSAGIKASSIEEAIREIVSICFNVTKADMVSKSRLRHLNAARVAGFFLLKKNTEYSLSRVAAAFNRDNHATAWHGINSHYDWMDIHDPMYEPYFLKAEVMLDNFIKRNNF